eukprot:scaffold98696_cov18-Tisochrysis_lutea.AAC.2
MREWMMLYNITWIHIRGTVLDGASEAGKGAVGNQQGWHRGRLASNFSAKNRHTVLAYGTGQPYIEAMGDCCSEWNFEVKLDQLSALAVYGLMAANKVGKEAMGKCGSELGQQCCNHQIGKGDNGGYNAVNLAEEACAFLLQRVPACVCDAALNGDQ